MKTQANIVVLAEGDNVGVAVQPIGPGDSAHSAAEHHVTAAEEIPLGHKIALRPIASGERIIRLGVPVGIATADIATGQLVHVHNVKSQYLDNVEDHYE
jgi:altronate dehydratase